MKKTILFFSLLVCSFYAHSQSKEETIAWINTYAGELLKPFNKMTVSNEGTIVVKYEPTNSYVWTNTFNVKDILIENVISDSNRVCKDDLCKTFYVTSYFVNIKFNGDKVHATNSLGENKYINSSWCQGPKKTDVERVAKAIYHLAKLFGATEKPKKDAF